jgi:predicted NUDIX family NTP pyrophosphohydrolase
MILLMKRKISAGLLMYRFKDEKLQFFIGHPGGPFWDKQDKGAWSIPKGEVDEGETLMDTAKREFFEETGINADFDESKLIDLGSVIQKSGKAVYIWAFEGDWSGEGIGKSMVNTEYPQGSGKFISFPELDKLGFFNEEEARFKLNGAQIKFIDRLINFLN